MPCASPPFALKPNERRIRRSALDKPRGVVGEGSETEELEDEEEDVTEEEGETGGMVYWGKAAL